MNQENEDHGETVSIQIQDHIVVSLRSKQNKKDILSYEERNFLSIIINVAILECYWSITHKLTQLNSTMLFFILNCFTKISDHGTLPIVSHYIGHSFLLNFILSSEQLHILI
jgi:hypothetical protein